MLSRYFSVWVLSWFCFLRVDYVWGVWFDFGILMLSGLVWMFGVGIVEFWWNLVFLVDFV